MKELLATIFIVFVVFAVRYVIVDSATQGLRELDALGFVFVWAILLSGVVGCFSIIIGGSTPLPDD
jgi:hypothetical protein